MAREVELKLDIDPAGFEALRRSDALLGAEAIRRHQLARYYDTRKSALAEAGLSLRVRRSGDRHVQTLKLGSSDAAAGLFDRQEWEWDVASLDLDPSLLADTPAASLLKRKARLVPQFEVEVDRTSWRREGMTLFLDQGIIRSGERTTQVAEIEIEADGAEPRHLFDLAYLLTGVAPLRLGVLTKADRGQRLLDGRLGRFAKAEPVTLSAAASVADGFSAIAYNCLRHYRLNEMVLMAAPEPDAVHQARVALRRLRSALSLFGKATRDRDHEQLREELRWFTAILGPARNFDVMIKRLPRTRKSEDKALRRALDQARQEAYDAALEAIGSERLRLLMLDLLRWLALGSWRDSEEAQVPLGPYIAKRLDRRWKKVRAAGRQLESLAEEPRHRLRIDIKKMRYAAEFLADLHTGEAVADRRSAFLKALEDMQEHLGELNDLATGMEIANLLPLSPDEKAAALRLTTKAVDEAQSLAEAQLAFERLSEAGPYWRR